MGRASVLRPGGSALRRLSLAIAGTAAALVLASCVSAEVPKSNTPSQDSNATTEDYYSQTLAWSECGAAECATLTVPKDYEDPSLGEIELEVLRQPAGGDSQGSLVVNPGGPGGSGVDYARAASAVLPPAVTEVYDVVGFDPRGVKASQPVECMTDAETDAWLAEDSNPKSPEEAERLAELSAEFGQRCAERASDIYPYVDTASVVQDLDVLRAALGEEQLDYVGKSYGTLIGALYADDYPDKVGRMVLDGVLPPDLTSEEIGLGQAKGFEDTLERFVADCQKKQECPLPRDSVEAGVQRIQQFLDELGEEPLDAKPGRPLTQSLALGSILYHLYFPSYGDWEKLSRGLKEAFDGDGSRLLGMYDERLERSPDGTYADNSQDAFYAVTCLDRGTDVTAETLADRSEAWADEAPTFGPYLAWSDLVCSTWPTPANGEPRKVSATGANPILIVSTTHDPATPYVWAEALAADLDNAKLVTWDQDGHTGYSSGSTCVDEVVDAYLVDGTMPQKNVSCPS